MSALIRNSRALPAVVSLILAVSTMLAFVPVQCVLGWLESAEALADTGGVTLDEHSTHRMESVASAAPHMPNHGEHDRSGPADERPTCDDCLVVLDDCCSPRADFSRLAVVERTGLLLHLVAVSSIVAPLTRHVDRSEPQHRQTFGQAAHLSSRSALGVFLI